jgi:hypothetical protein
MKYAWIAIFILISPIVPAQQTDMLKFRISLTDKAVTTYSLNRPHEFLSEKAINRRTRQHLPIDSTDLPVCSKYMNAIKQTGVKIVTTGKWDNFVTVSCNDEALIDKIAKLPFVRNTEKVWTDPQQAQTTVGRDTIAHTNAGKTENEYGAAYGQIRLNNGHKLHAAGFRGKGMTIAVIDAGFHNADNIKLLKNIHVLGTKDFVNPNSDIYAESDHGTKVLSCMATNQKYIMTGTAPQASYWLLRSEDERSEHLVEQDYWAAAVEFADSVGADLINSSLGYYAFDDTLKNYTHDHLNGHYALISRQASKVADKGMILVCSAGNAGNKAWQKITTPADADNILTVGAVDKDTLATAFSSTGNTADYRIKPDIMAVGSEVWVMCTDGNVGKANGTSFSSPMICGMAACLWQACPQLTAKEVIALIRRSGNRFTRPDHIYGYGVPDMWKAHTLCMPVLPVAKDSFPAISQTGRD